VVLVFRQRVWRKRFLPTKRAVDLWDSAASRSIFLASGFFCSQAFSQPAHKPLTQTVGKNLAQKSLGVLQNQVVFQIGV
jgi:hypothetical protein